MIRIVAACDGDTKHRDNVPATKAGSSSCRCKAWSPVFGSRAHVLNHERSTLLDGATRRGRSGHCSARTLSAVSDRVWVAQVVGALAA